MKAVTALLRVWRKHHKNDTTGFLTRTQIAGNRLFYWLFTTFRCALKTHVLTRLYLGLDNRYAIRC